MPRYKLTIEYDGTGFAGWQRQKNGLSVQKALETAITRFCGERVPVRGAGRTDAGVHALGQTAHLDLTRVVAPEVLRSAVNHHLRPAAGHLPGQGRAAELLQASRPGRQSNVHSALKGTSCSG